MDVARTKRCAPSGLMYDGPVAAPNHDVNIYDLPHLSQADSYERPYIESIGFSFQTFISPIPS